MTQAPAKLDTYEADFQLTRTERAASSPAWLTELGDQAWSSFSQLGFPTARRGNERWKYTNVAPVARAGFRLSRGLTPDIDSRLISEVDGSWTRLVFVDGRFSKALSAVNSTSSGALVANLGDAINSGASNVEQYMAKHADFQDDGFTALNTAFLNDGAFVYLPDGVEAESPIHLIFVTTDRDQPRACHPRTLIVIGQNARATVVESYFGTAAGPADAQSFTNAVTEIVIGDGAEVDHYRLLMENPLGFYVGTSRVSQGRDSAFSSASFALGTTLARNDFEVLLDGPGSSCTLNGLYLTTEGQHMDNLISIDHAKPYTSSKLTYKGILDGKSRAVFGGQVLVRKDAQKVTAYQTDKNLLLSEQAEVDSKPSLLIYADDVQCGHGATAGHTDEDSLFYLRSRGLDSETANRMLVHAFAREIIEMVKLEPLREYLDRLFLDAIPTTGVRIGGRR